MIPIDEFSDTLLKALGKIWMHLNQTGSFITHIVAIHSKAVGSFRLKSSNPYDYPLIDARFLSDADSRDIDTLYEGIKLA